MIGKSKKIIAYLGVIINRILTSSGFVFASSNIVKIDYYVPIKIK